MTAKDSLFPPPRHIIAGVVAFIAAILIWRAIWDLTAELFNPITSLIIGLALVVVVAIVEKNFIKKVFSP